MSTHRETDTIGAPLLLRAQELVHIGTWTWDVARDSVQWSDELFRLFDLEPQSEAQTYESFLGRVHPNDRDRGAALIAGSLRDRAPFDFDYTLLKPTASGAIRHFSSRGNVVCDDRGVVTHLVGTCADVTDAVAQTKALRESEERFRTIVEQSAVGLVVCNADGRLIQANSTFANMLGYTERELATLTFEEITHPDDLAMTRLIKARTSMVRGASTYEKRYLRKDGSVVWARASVTRLRGDDGTPDGYTAVIEDITERKCALDALTNQTELLQSIMDNLPVMVSMFDADSKPLYVNREWQRVFGWTLGEVRAIDLFATLYPDPGDAERARQGARNGTARWEDLAPRNRAGQPVPSTWACMSLSDGTSLTIGQDLTAHRQLQERLAQAQKMEALGQLAGGIAHDFNNILTIISAYAAFLHQDVGQNPRALEDVSEIMTAADRAAALTRQLLAFSRRQLLCAQIVDVDVVIEAIAKTLVRVIGEHIELSILPHASDPCVEVDVHQLEQVLLNLVVNARDAIQNSGTITVETRNAMRPVAGGIPRMHLEIAISDDGCGIDPAIRDRIFEPFFTTKPVGKGTGLGLATVHGIIQQLGAHLSLDSTVGVGTTFTIALPVVERADVLPVGDRESDALGSGETVLLVEDEAPLRAVARRALTELGYVVLEARHGADAARLSESHGSAIDLLITDVVMPELGGRELARLVRRRHPDVRILYVSGYTDDELLRRGILEPGAELLRKPFIPLELGRAAKRLLQGEAAFA